MDKLGQDGSSVAPIFISVDPDRDTPGILKDYVKGFSEKIWGLTGDKNAVANAAKAYRVYYRKAGKGEDYSVDHSAFIYLMDQDGNYLTHFPFNSSADAIVGVIKKHIPTGKSA
jgi:protein SCO1